MSALEGLRIVDFSRFLPGAYASWIAADLGAEMARVGGEDVDAGLHPGDRVKLHILLNQVTRVERD